MRIQQFRKVFGGTRAVARTNTGRPGWMREFAWGVAAGNLVRHGAGVPGAHRARACERQPYFGPTTAGRSTSER